jgi:hypothetical protein
MALEHDESIDWERLDRFVRGAGSWEERASLTAWVESNPHIRQLAETMRTVGGLRTGPTPDAYRALREVQRQLGIADRPDRISRPAGWSRR